ncbi:MAG: PAS domain S-box protein [Proteobacteria bacterium]|nr:PAS domain S-box protein [Pseudomonadota bacterium]MBU1584600.1 PAS domain S-box protein [Pseudomonadota bacterium]MBU2452493.1 PAS domain S-box protein [Pseudomonadota bacterium]
MDSEINRLRQRILELEKNQENISQHNAYLSTLNDLSTGLMNHTELNRLLETIVKDAARLAGTDHGFIHMFDSKTNQLGIQIGIGGFEKAIGYKLKPNNGLAGIAFATKNVARVDDYGKWEHRLPGRVFKGLKACVAIPLKNYAGIIGLGRFDGDDNIFTDQQVDVLKRFADMASICIENTKVYSRLQKELAKRQRAENSLKVSEEEFQTIFEDIQEGFYRTNEKAEIIMANPVAVKMLGYDSIEEAEGLVMVDLYKDPKDRDKVIELLMKDGKITAYEVEMKKRDGSYVTVLVSAHARYNDKGEFIGVQGTVLDISGRKKLEAERVHSQKLESIGQLAAGIAHEINTPIQYVTDNTGFIQDAFDDLLAFSKDCGAFIEQAENGPVGSELIEKLASSRDETDLEFLEKEVPLAIHQTLEGLERVSKIVKSMKEFSHPGGEEGVLTDINHALDNTVIVARNEWKYVAELSCDFDPLLPLIACNPGELNQVFLNMIINASHAIAEKLGKTPKSKGQIHISTACKDKWVEIRIKDTGAGIPEKVRTHIFDPFFTTKQVGKGTGQGLAISWNVIVEKYKGKIEVETHDNCGTTFIIRLPVEDSL